MVYPFLCTNILKIKFQLLPGNSEFTLVNDQFLSNFAQLDYLSKEWMFSILYFETREI